jgi:hypothetical protein
MVASTMNHIEADKETVSGDEFRSISQKDTFHLPKICNGFVFILRDTEENKNVSLYRWDSVPAPSIVFHDRVDNKVMHDVLLAFCMLIEPSEVSRSDDKYEIVVYGGHERSKNTIQCIRDCTEKLSWPLAIRLDSTFATMKEDDYQDMLVNDRGLTIKHGSNGIASSRSFLPSRPPFIMGSSEIVDCSGISFSDDTEYAQESARAPSRLGKCQ